MSEHDAEQTKAVAVRHEPQNAAVELWGSNDPRQMTARMAVVADAIKDVIRSRGLYSNIQGRDYVTVEGWSMTGAMIGVFPRTREIRVIEEGHLDALTVQRKRRGGQGTYEVHHPEFDGVITYEASVDLVTRDGGVVGGAVALCSRREEQWRDREDNQIASMAQTRAIAKAYRMTLGFVMPMAGYAATPAEEMTEAAVAQEPQSQVEPEGRRPSSPVADRAGRSGAVRTPEQPQARPVAGEAQASARTPFWAEPLKHGLAQNGLDLDDVAGAIGVERATNAAINSWFNNAEGGRSVGDLVAAALAYRKAQEEEPEIIEGEFSESSE